MDVHEAINDILEMCDEAREEGEPLPVDLRFLDTLLRYEAERLGLPHPLSGFGLNGYIPYGNESDVILDSLNALAFEKKGSVRWCSAVWFLFEDDTIYFDVCRRIGLDGERFREHIKRMQKTVAHLRR